MSYRNYLFNNTTLLHLHSSAEKKQGREGVFGHKKRGAEIRKRKEDKEDIRRVKQKGGRNRRKSPKGKRAGTPKPRVNQTLGEEEEKE